MASKGLAANGADMISSLLVDCFDMDLELIREPKHLVALGAFQIFDLVLKLKQFTAINSLLKDWPK